MPPHPEIDRRCWHHRLGSKPGNTWLNKASTSRTAGPGCPSMAGAQPVSDLAREHEVSREFLSEQAHAAQDALIQAFDPDPKTEDVFFYLPVTEAWIRQLVLGLELNCHRRRCSGWPAAAQRFRSRHRCLSSPSAPYSAESALLNRRTEFLRSWGLRPSLRTASRVALVGPTTPKHRARDWPRKGCLGLPPSTRGVPDLLQHPEILDHLVDHLLELGDDLPLKLVERLPLRGGRRARRR